MPTIDNLEIQIKAEASKAAPALDKLGEALSNLSNKLGKVDTVKLGNIASGIEGIAKSTTNFRATGAKELNAFARSVEKLEKLNTGNLVNVGTDLRDFSSKINGVSIPQLDVSGIVNVADSLSRLGGKKAVEGGKNLILVKDDIIKFVEGLNNIGAVNFNVGQLEQVVSAITRLGSQASTNSISNLPGITQNLGEFITKLNTLQALKFDTGNLAILVQSISRLGGKTATNAITNIPVLATALRDMFNVLSKAPVISENVIRMTNAIANLAAQGQKTSSASKSMINGLLGYNKGLRTSTNLTKSFAAAIGKFYATWFLAIRGIKGIWKETQSAMDYVETYNYFAVTMDKVGKQFSKDFAEYGYDNAEAYANSFTTRLGELTKKITGFNVGTKGELQESGLSNLGADPEQLMKFQAKIGGVTNSVGLLGETTLNTQKALSMLAYDMSSLTNLPVEEVMTNLSSGLIGQSRALYKYGVDITNATLQEVAYAHGVTKATQAMTQSEKMQLRLLAILQQTRVYYGDMANTVSSVANQYRIFGQQAKNLGRILGNLVLPIVQRVLPVINGLVIALQRLFTQLGFKLYGADWLTNIMDGISGGAGAADDLEDAMDGVEDSLDNSSKAAKKLKQQLQGFDELNVISTPNDSGAGSGLATGTFDLGKDIADALADYEKVWNDAFNKMENKAGEWANAIEKWFAPVKAIFNDLFDGNFLSAGKRVGNLVKGLFNMFTDAIKKVNWKKLGKAIGDFISGIDWIGILKSVGRLIWEALKASLELWVGALSSAPIETAILTVIGLPKLVSAIFNTKLSTTLVNGVIGLLDKFKNLKTALGGFIDLAKNEGVLSALGTKLSNITSNMSAFSKVSITGATLFVEFHALQDIFKDLFNGSESLIASLGKIAVVAGVAGAALQLALGPIGWIVDAVVVLGTALYTLQDIKIADDIKAALVTENGVPLNEAFDMVSNSIYDTVKGFSELSEESKKLDDADKNIQTVWKQVEILDEQFKSGLIDGEKYASGLASAFDALEEAVSTKFTSMNSYIIGAFGENGIWKTSFEDAGYDVSKVVTEMIGLSGEMQNEAISLIHQISELSAVDPTNPKLAELRSQLNDVIGVTTDFTDILNEMKYEIETMEIDYSSLVLDDGTLNTDAVDKYLNDIGTSIANAQETIKTSGDELYKNLEFLYKGALKDGDTTLANEIKAMMDDIPNILNTKNKEIAKAATDFTDRLQRDLIQKTVKIVEDGGEEAALEFTKFGAGVVTKLSNEIDSKFKELGVDGAGWSKDAIMKIGQSFIGAFQTEERGMHEASKKMLKNSVEDVIKESAKTNYNASKDAAENVGKGFKEGSKTWDSYGFDKNASITFGTSIISGVMNALDEHSPSKEFERIAQYIGDGFAIGMETSTNTIGSVLGNLKGTISQAISPLYNDMKDIGRYTIQGFMEGIDSLMGDVNKKISGIGENVKKVLRDALKIHSPSKAMFEIGEYTIEGFQLGMENLYGRTEKSLTGFSGKLINNMSEIGDVNMSYSMDGRTSGYNNANQTDNSALVLVPYLQELISVTKQNGSVGGRTVSDQYIFDSFRKSADEFYNRYGRSPIPT